ncbi:MAG: hypothetical protein ACW99F_06660 [Candidatus Hodarchaeales archaeon]|jgi:hypothetical protein
MTTSLSKEEKERRAKMDELFDPEKYTKNSFNQTGGNGKQFFFADGTDALANKDFIITIKHVPSGKMIKFKAFITAFNDTFAQDWNSEPVYGRADPLYNFKQTTRRISIGFKMPAASEGEAYENLTKAQQLSQFMYPNYTDVNGAKTLSQGPLLRLQVMNLLQSTKNKERNSIVSPSNLYTSYGAGDEGMLGFCSDVTFNFNLENSDHGVFQKADGTILPKLIEVSIGGFSPIHEHHLGWDQNDIFSDGLQFPYGAQGAEPDVGSDAGASYSAIEQAKDERAKAEAAIANAEARYGGMFGDARRKRDQRKMAKRKYSDSKAAYVASAQAGAAAIDAAEIQQIYDEVMGPNDPDYMGGTYDPVDFVEY